jgi:hypothetical protein
VCALASYVTVAGTPLPPVTESSSVDASMVLAFIGLLNVTIIVVPTATSLAPAAGFDAVTVGGVSSLTVKLDAKAGASVFPARSLTFVIATVTPLALGSDGAGRNSAMCVVLEYETVPAIEAPPADFSTNVELLTVDESTASLNVAVIVAEVETPAVPDAGVDAVTRGGVTSGGVIADDGESADNAEIAPETPLADTAYLYAVSSSRPSSVNEVVVTSLTFVPFLKTL